MDDVIKAATETNMSTPSSDIMAAQAVIDSLQAAACKCQSDMHSDAKLLLCIILKELMMLKVLVNKVS